MLPEYLGQDWIQKQTQLLSVSSDTDKLKACKSLVAPPCQPQKAFPELQGSLGN